MVALRRDIHAHPELAWHEVRTSALVAHELVRAGLAPTPLPGGTGLVCDIGEPARPDGGAAGRPRRPADRRREGRPLPVVNARRGPRLRPRRPHRRRARGRTRPGPLGGCRCSSRAGSGWCSSRPRRSSPAGRWPPWTPAPSRGWARVFALHCDPRVDAGSVAVRAGPITGATDSVTVRLSGPAVTRPGPSSPSTWLRPWPTCWSGRRPCCRGGWTPAPASLWSGEGWQPGRRTMSSPNTARRRDSVRVLDPVGLGVGGRAGPRADPKRSPRPTRPGSRSTTCGGSRRRSTIRRPPRRSESAAAALLGPAAVHETPQSMGAEDFAWFLDRVPGVLAPPGGAPARDARRSRPAPWRLRRRRGGHRLRHPGPSCRGIERTAGPGASPHAAGSRIADRRSVGDDQR